jgi:hypothetical protein
MFAGIIEYQTKYDEDMKNIMMKISSKLMTKETDFDKTM